MSAWLEYKDEDEAHDDEHEEEDAFSSTRVSLIAAREVRRISFALDEGSWKMERFNLLRRNIELLHRFLYM
jgi:cation transport regulator ChaB